MQLTIAQQKAVDEILENYEKGQRVIDFKAPTGSGKTFMAANVIDQIILSNKNDQKLVFVIATLSSSDLPIQLKNKFNKYKKYLHSNFIIERKESPSKNKNKVKDMEPSILAENNKVIILGKSSFGKRRLFTEYDILERFIDQIQTENYKLIYIRDEAHIGGSGEKTLKNSDTESQLQDNAAFVIRMTATPKLGIKQVVLTEAEINDDEHDQFLLKSNPVFNPGIKTIKTDDNLLDSMELLDIALNNFKAIKKEYKSSGINPAMLIQVNSINQNGMSKEKLDIFVKKITKKINKDHGLQWVKYFGGSDKSSSTLEDINLDNISQSTSSVDVIIFKVGPATGWDIPRACMLLQLREVYSESLNQQTLGRIKRNPIPGLSKEDFSDNYYVYSNYQEPSRDLYFYSLLPEFEREQIPTIIATEKRIISKKALQELRDALKEWFRLNRAGIVSHIETTFFNNAKRLPFKKIRLYDTNKKQQSLKGENFVYNSIELRIEIHKERNKVKREFNNMKDIFRLWFQDLVKNHTSFNKTQLYYVILNQYWSEIINVYKKIYVKKVDYDYLVDKTNNLKKEYMIWGNKGKVGEKGELTLDFENVKTNYAYINSDNKSKYLQALDSNPEKIFMEAAINTIEDNLDDVVFWAKNPSLGNKIALEYKNAFGSKSQAFIDFVFKMKNGYTFYIEVKGKKDYNKEKTTKILEAFSEYRKSPDVKDNKMEFYIVFANTEEYKNLRTKEKLNYMIDLHHDEVQAKKRSFADMFEIMKMM